MKKWEATDTSDDSTVTQWNPSPPDSWLSDDSIENIRAVESVDTGWYCWKEVDQYLSDQGYSVTELNDLRSKYPAFKDYVIAERTSEANTLLTEAENSGDLTSSEVSEIKSILGL